MKMMLLLLSWKMNKAQGLFIENKHAKSTHKSVKKRHVSYLEHALVTLKVETCVYYFKSGKRHIRQEREIHVCSQKDADVASEVNCPTNYSERSTNLF